MKHFAYILIACLLTSCVTQERCLEKFGNTASAVSNDSIVIERVTDYRDTVIEVPGATSFAFVDAPCDTNGILKVFQKTFKDKTGKATVTVKAENNKLSAECNCDGEKVIIEKQRERIRQFETSQSSEKNTAVLTEVKAPWWAKWWLYPACIVGGWTCGALGVHKLLWKLIKSFF